MFRLAIVFSAVTGMAAATGCVAGGTARVSAGATISTPELVYIGPGVYVIEDYHRPVFYSNNYYWLYRDGIWFRSHVYTGNWVRARTVPREVRRIERPQRYVRYRADRRDRDRPRVQVRDHRQRPYR
jgi:hypothetical protein